MDVIYLKDSDVKEFITFLVVTHVERCGLKKKHVLFLILEPTY